MTRAQAEYLKGVAEAVDGDDYGTLEDYTNAAAQVPPADLIALCDLWLTVSDLIEGK